MNKILIPFLLAALFIGCATAEKNAYKATGSVIITVDAVMKSWSDYVKAGHATQAQQDNVRNAYQKYYLAIQAEKAVVLSPSRDGTPIGYVKAISDASSALISLVESFLPSDTIVKP